MNKSDLIRLINEKEKQFEKAKIKRFITTAAVFAIFYYIILYWVEDPSGFALIGNILLAVIFSGIHCLVNGAIFGHLFQKAEAENRMLNDLRNQLSENE